MGSWQDALSLRVGLFRHAARRSGEHQRPHVPCLRRVLILPPVQVDLVSLHLDMGEWKVDLVFPVSVADRPPPSTQWISSLSPLTFLDLDRDDTSSTR